MKFSINPFPFFVTFFGSVFYCVSLRFATIAAVFQLCEHHQHISSFPSSNTASRFHHWIGFIAKTICNGNIWYIYPNSVCICNRNWLKSRTTSRISFKLIEYCPIATWMNHWSSAETSFDYMIIIPLLVTFVVLILMLSINVHFNGFDYYLFMLNLLEINFIYYFILIKSKIGFFVYFITSWNWKYLNKINKNSEFGQILRTMVGISNKKRIQIKRAVTTPTNSFSFFRCRML